MENNHESTGPESSSSTKEPNYNQNHRKETNQRTYYDLRQVINQKRQAKEESKTNVPPVEPKYNFLSDPIRDGHDNSKPEHFNRGRFSHRGNSNLRSRGRGRGRGRGYQGNNYNPNFREEDNLRPDGSTSAPHHNKNNEFAEHEGTRFRNSQYRPFSKRPNFRKYEQGSKPENFRNQTDQQETGEKFNNYKSYNSKRYDQGNKTDNSVNNEQSETNPRKNYPARGGQYFRPAYRHNSQFRGQSYKRNLKSADPMNITVEYSVESGIRKCTAERKSSIKERQQNSVTLPKCPEFESEENWDEEISNTTTTKNENQDEGEQNSKEIEREEESSENLDEGEQNSNEIEREEESSGENLDESEQDSKEIEREEESNGENLDEGEQNLKEIEREKINSDTQENTEKSENEINDNINENKDTEKNNIQENNKKEKESKET